MRCIIHGSFRKYWTEIEQASQTFRQAGIDVLAPKTGKPQSIHQGFALFADEIGRDPREIEIEYLHQLKRLGSNGFSYFVNPEGRLGTSASFELGIAQSLNIPCYFLHPLKDHPAYVPRGHIISPQKLAESFQEKQRLPNPSIKPKLQLLHRRWKDLVIPSSIVATGGIIEHDDAKRQERDILLVKTHKWLDRYSVVGGKVRHNESLHQTLRREIQEETGLSSKIRYHLATFDQIKNSGYYQSHINHIFVDYVVEVSSKKVILNEEAQEYLWIPAEHALKELDLEPNARTIVELYAKNQSLYRMAHA